MNVIKAIEDYGYWCCFHSGNRSMWDAWRGRAVEEWHLNPEVLNTERMDYMAKIDEIYNRLYGETPEGMRADNNVTEKIKGEILLPIEDFTKLTREELADLIYAGSSYGQKQGFESGFKYAMALMFESLVC